MKKKILKISGYIVLGIIIILLGFFIWARYEIETGQLVKWEGKWYTKEELEEKFPPQQYEVEAKNTPKEVYTKFRQALLNNDKEKALKFIEEDERGRYRDAFRDETKFKEWVNKLPKDIKLEAKHENRAYYDLDMGTEYKNTITFVKQQNGYWKIETI